MAVCKEEVKAGGAALLRACQAQLVCLTPEDLSDAQDCRSGPDTKVHHLLLSSYVSAS